MSRMTAPSSARAGSTARNSAEAGKNASRTTGLSMSASMSAVYRHNDEGPMERASAVSCSHAARRYSWYAAGSSARSAPWTTSWTRSCIAKPSSVRDTNGRRARRSKASLGAIVGSIARSNDRVARRTTLAASTTVRVSPGRSSTYALASSWTRCAWVCATVVPTAASGAAAASCNAKGWP